MLIHGLKTKIIRPLDDYLPNETEAINKSKKLVDAINRLFDAQYEMTDMLSNLKAGQDIPKEELWQGELYGKIYEIGQFLIRSAVRCYVNDYLYQNDHPDKLTPLTDEQLRQIDEEHSEYNGIKALLRRDYSVRCRTGDVAYRYISGLPKESWHLSISSIVTLRDMRENAATDEILCLWEVYDSDSFTRNYCMFCRTNGDITRHYLDGYLDQTITFQYPDMEGGTNESVRIN